MDNERLLTIARRHPNEYPQCPTCMQPNRCLIGELVDYVIALKIRNGRLLNKVRELET